MRRVVWTIVLAFPLAGCHSQVTNAEGGSGGQGASDGGAPTTSGQGGETIGMGGSGAGSTTSSTGDGGGPIVLTGSCSDDPPANAKVAPPPKPYTGGACPSLAAGMNTLTSNGHSRSFLLAFPADLKPDERAPVIFLWHWLGGSAQDFYDKGEVQAAVDTQRFIAVMPVSKGDVNFQWPFESVQSDARVEEEFVFFDDMLSCVSAQFDPNPNCVATVGVSAGALFTDQLAAGRADYLSSFISLSGGVGGSFIRPWGHPDRALPGIVLWGGPTDTCVVINFTDASQELEQGLVEDGSFFVECVHNCGHTEPPFEAPPGLSKYAGLWQFVFDHPYWLSPGASPYLESGLPVGMPAWCGIGPGSAPPSNLSCSGGGC